jgi:hypothetical protein
MFTLQNSAASKHATAEIAEKPLTAKIAKKSRKARQEE